MHESSSWFLDGLGYNIFYSVPKGEPSLAKAKPEVKWSRTLLERTIRSWYQFMVVDTPAELRKIKAKWQNVFTSLLVKMRMLML
eukprot:2601909-Pleurochrysis_carterae.AAC.2